MSSKKFRRRGFTLVELVIVLVLMSIVATIAVSHFSGNTVTLYGQTQRLMSDLRYTQSLAMTHGQRYRLTITPPNTYAITDINGNVVTDPQTGSSSTSLSSGITFGTPTNLPSNVIAFDERGIPYTNSTATTALAVSATIPLSTSSATRILQITPDTGRVIIQ